MRRSIKWLAFPLLVVTGCSNKAADNSDAGTSTGGSKTSNTGGSISSGGTETTSGGKSSLTSSAGGTTGTLAGGTANKGGSTSTNSGGSTLAPSGGTTSVGSMAVGGMTTATSGGVTGTGSTPTGGSTAIASGGITSMGGSTLATGGAAADAGPPCVAALFGSYIVRGDGKLLEETVTGLSGSQTTVLDGTSGLPLASVQNVQDGTAHGCATVQIPSDQNDGADASMSGSAWCWRTAANGNSMGQLGNGVIDTNGAVFHASKVLTATGEPLSNVVSVADGPGNTACAVTEEGNLYCWGDLTWITNAGVSLSSAYAVLITTDGSKPLSNVLKAAVHPTFACAIVKGSSSNEVDCWGFNQGNVANLGVGDSVNHKYPTRVLGPTNPTNIEIADFNGLYGTTCALDGARVRCWGSTQAVGNVNSNGTNPALVTLQDGSTALDGVVNLKRGLQNYCALRTDATLWCWGGGFKSYAVNFTVTNVLMLGEPGGLGGSSPGDVRFLTSDSAYHIGTGTRTPECGPL